MSGERNHQQLLEAIATQAELVRSVQKDYFRTRDNNTLRLSKAREKELDELLARWRSGQQPLLGEGFC